jgi:hypothetical protein
MATPVDLPRVGQLGSIGKAPDLPAILSNVPNSFAWHVWRDRHPALLGQIREAHTYPPQHLDAMERLLAETLEGEMESLPADAPDRAAWAEWGRDYLGRPWLNAPFLWAESYFYRRLLDAIEFFTPGPWFGIDPFEFLKSAELDAPSLDADLLALDAIEELPAREKTQALMHAALWGNRADLGFRIGVAATTGQLGPSAHLVADDSATALSALYTEPAGRVCLIADNAGRELLADLLLIDRLFEAGLVSAVTLHLKPHPYYVSDAVTADLAACLRRLAAAPKGAGDAARRLRRAAADGRLAVYTHWFYCAPFSFHYMPPDLADEVASASLAVLKGDLNYRRLVGDCVWPEVTPFAEAAGYFPAPVVALRTLKSDVVVGLDVGTVSELDATATSWRTSGTHGLVQVRL